MHRAYERYFSEDTQMELDADLEEAELAVGYTSDALETAAAPDTDVVRRASAFVEVAEGIESSEYDYERYFDTLVAALREVRGAREGSIVRAIRRVEDQRSVMRHSRHLERTKLEALRSAYPASDVDPVALYHAMRGTTPPERPIPSVLTQERAGPSSSSGRHPQG